MGHIFQMKPNNRLIKTIGIGSILLLFVLQSGLIPELAQAAVSKYEYAQKDKAEEKKKSILRLERDKHKVELAVEVKRCCKGNCIVCINNDCALCRINTRCC